MDRDSDSVSINSTVSGNSDSSGQLTSTKQLELSEEVSNSTETSDLGTSEVEPSVETSGVFEASEGSVTVVSDANKVEVTEEQAVTSNVDVTSERKSDETDESKQKIKPEISESDSKVEHAEPTGSDQISNTETVCLDDSQKAKDIDLDNVKSTIETQTQKIETAINADILPSNEQTLIVAGAPLAPVLDIYKDAANVSNLDVEISRLESYLSDKSNVKYSETEKTVNDLHQSRAAVEQILLKDARHRMHGLTEDRNVTYTPSSLEKALEEFEKSSMLSDKGETSNEQKSPLSLGGTYTPSIYTIYNKPGVENDDFYSQFLPKSQSEMSSLLSNSSLADKKSDFEDNNGAADLVPLSALPNFMKAVNSWTEIELQGNVYSLSVSATHVWVTDRSTNIFYSALNGPGLSWKRASGYATQISVSKGGNIVWALNKGTVSAGTKITAKRPEGMKWVEAVKDVSYMCVDETCAW